MSPSPADWNRAAPGLKLATKNVLLVTCMDLRLLDDVVRFMDEQNLTNRYDQFISAGASLTLSRPRRGDPDPFASMRHAFYDHLELAVALHQVRYVYVIEHLDCGAYKYSGTPHYGEDDPEADVRAHKGGFDEFYRDLREYLERKQARPSEIPDLRSTRRRQTDSSEFEPFRRPMRPMEVKKFRELIGKIYADRYRRKPLKEDWERVRIEGFLMTLKGQVEYVIT